MNARSYGWFVMTLLAAGVAGYAGAVVFFGAVRPDLVRTLIADRPLFAFAHFSCGAIALLAGALQLNTKLRMRFISVHRWLGRSYVVAIALGGTASLVLAFQAMGGIAGRTGFGSLAVCWLLTTPIAYRRIRAGDVQAHRRWMIRSYALTLAAVTLRIYIPVSQILGIPFETAYPIIAWACWVPNLVIAEWFIRTRPAVENGRTNRVGSPSLGNAS